MISLSKRVSILIEIFKELKQRGDPDTCVEKYYKFPVDASKAREIISEFHNNPSVIDNCSQNERDSFYLVLVGYPLYVAFDYLNQQYKTLFPTPLDSKELFESVKSYIPKRGVTFDYFGKINPAISYLLVESVEKDDFNSFNKLILEYYDQLKDPLLRIFHFHSHDNENDSSNDIPWEVREALLSEQYKLGYPFEPEMEEIVRDAIDLTTARIMVGKVEIAYLESYFNLLGDTFIQSIKELHRFIAKQYLSGHFYYSPYIENEALGKLINSPLFPEIYEEVRTEIEGRKENEKQEKPQSTTQTVSQEPEGEEYVPHWPTDDELKGYPDNFSGSEFFPNTLFGSAGNVKASDVKRLLDVLIDLKIIQDELQTKLIFLARYSGKRIPHLELKPIEWRMLDDTNREKALGYLILKTANAKYAIGNAFFYYDINGEIVKPNKRKMGFGAHALDLPTRRDTTKIEFEYKLNEFLTEYRESKKG